MTEPAVDIRSVAKNFGTFTALQNIDFSIAPGEFVSLLGASGCGKSTLLRIISGFETPSSGTVRIHGRDVTQSPPERRPTNMVFQRGALFPHMTVAQNIAYALKLKRWDRARIAARVEEMIALVRLGGMAVRRPAELSGGQAQRVALARALAAEPQVLLLDEPLSALDLKLRQQMQLELRAIQKQLGATFIFVTHDQTEALVMSDRIAIMQGGRILQHGTPREIYRQPNSVYVSDFVGDTNLLRGQVAQGSLVTPWGSFAAPAFAEGTKAALSLRPESVRMIPAGTGKLTGQVEVSIYQGNVLRLGIRIAADLLLWADLPEDGTSGPEIGQTVGLDWTDTTARVVAEEAPL